VLLYASYKRSGKDTEKALDIAFKLLNRMRENGVEMVKIKVA